MRGRSAARGFGLAFLGTAAVLLAGCASGPDRGQQADLLIAGGEVIDGTGAPPRRLDVSITGERISFIGDARKRGVSARRIVNAAGMVVAPGFIDPHTHSGDDLTSGQADRRSALNHLMQGVTTVFVGNDGGGAPDLTQRLEASASAGIGVNAAAYVGFGPVRRAALGDSARDPDPAELGVMRTLVAKAMCEGALGFSTGLYYAPQSFAKTEEVTALAREAASRGGVYDTHLRDEGSETIGLAAAVDEAIGIGRAAGLPVHIAHIKALGVDVHGKAPEIVARIEAARAQGLRVTADQYPWSASGTRLTSALVPRWAMEGGDAAMQKRLSDPSLAARLRAEMGDNLRRRGGPGAILITGGSQRGRRLDAVAAAWKVEPLTAAVRIIREEGDATIASFNMSEADIALFARQPWVMASSDASEGHPRRYGSFAERWRKFVRERPLLTPAQFVHRASGLTAATFGLAGRGSIRVGHFADIAIFDPARFAAAATYENPTTLALGVQAVVVNGALAVENGRPTGTLAGRALRKPRNPNWSCPS